MLDFLTEKVFGKVADIVDQFVTDKDKQIEFKAKLNTLQIEAQADVNKAQADINKQEAKHKSLFVSGWRPFVGWVCGVALCFNTIILPILLAIFPNIPVDSLDLHALYPVLLGILGIGIGGRSYEKGKGVASR